MSLEEVDLFLAKAFQTMGKSICRTNPSFMANTEQLLNLDELLSHLNNLLLHCLTKTLFP